MRLGSALHRSPAVLSLFLGHIALRFVLTVNRDAVALLAGFRGGLEAGGSIDESIDALCNRSIALLELVLPVHSEDQGRRGDVNTAEMFDSAVWLALHGDFL